MILNDELKREIADILVNDIGIDVVYEALIELVAMGDDLGDTWKEAINILEGKNDKEMEVPNS